MRSASEAVMPTPSFWAAFYVGLAGPASLYGATPNYGAYTQILPPAVSFGIVGSYMTEAAKLTIQDDDNSDRDTV
jgi:hypothetical protein